MGDHHTARVAEWQTRWLQVPVPARAWGFKSPLAHGFGYYLLRKTATTGVPCAAAGPLLSMSILVLVLVPVLVPVLVLVLVPEAGSATLSR